MDNQSTLTARAIVEWAINYGATDVVIAPGSRSAPLSYAFAQAQAAGDIRVHVRIDERDAGFLALGLAKAAGKPVPVVVTSGTAVANLVPAVVEAFYSGVELVVISADRPAAQRQRRSPQTIAQSEMFGTYVRKLDLAVAADVAKEISLLNSNGHTKPLHINVQFEMPLMPEVGDWKPQVARRIAAPREDSAESCSVPSRGLIIAGDINDQKSVEQISQLAIKLGWPIIWEPTANVHKAPNAIAHGVLLLASMQTPECIVTVGAVGLSRVVMAALKNTAQHLVIHLPSDGEEVPDPAGTARKVFHSIPLLNNSVDTNWLLEWKVAEEKAGNVVREVLSSKILTGPRVAIDVWNHADVSTQLFIAASWPVRHVEAYAPTRTGLRTLGNRGANGIDGLISTAWGAALTQQSRTYLLIGDIAFLHDIAGLNVSDQDIKPNLTIVVSDNDGSGIFGQLEQGAPEYAEHYERVFGTPHGKDLWVIAESFGIPAQRVTTTDELQRALLNTDKIPGVHVIVCTTGSRIDETNLIKKIATQVASELKS